MIGQNRFSTQSDLFDLFSKRWLRILPAYYFFFFLTAAVFHSFSQLVSSHIEYLFFLQNFAWKMPSFYFQTWTLAILEFFYVFFSLSLFLCFKFSRHKLLSFAVCIGLFCLIPFLLRALYVPLLGTEDFEATIRRWVIFRLDGPVAGVIMAVLFKEFPQIWSWLRTHSWIGLSLFGATVVYHLAGFPLLYTSHWAEVFFYPTVCATFALTLPVILTLKENTSFFGTAVGFLSKLSYSIYVSHVVAMVLILNILVQIWHLDVHNCLVVYPVCYAFILLVSYLSYCFVETPVVNAAQPRAKPIFAHFYEHCHESLARFITSHGLVKIPFPVLQVQPRLFA